MKCHEARQFIGPYLDSELDTKTSLEIEQHIEECAECNRLFASEEELDERTFSTLRQGGRTPSLWAMAEARVKPSAQRRLFGWKPLSVAGGLAAVVVLVLGVVWFNLKEERHVGLAAAAEEHHHEYVSGEVTPEFAGKVPEEVAKRNGDRLDAAAFTYSVADADFSTQGARVCDIAGVPVAWMLGSYKGTPVSMMVFKENELSAFAEIQKRFKSGETLVDCGKGHCEIVVRVISGHVICLIAGLPKPLVQHLAMSVQPPNQAVALFQSTKVRR